MTITEIVERACTNFIKRRYIRGDVHKGILVPIEVAEDECLAVAKAVVEECAKICDSQAKDDCCHYCKHSGHLHFHGGCRRCDCDGFRPQPAPREGLSAEQRAKLERVVATWTELDLDWGIRSAIRAALAEIDDAKRAYVKAANRANEAEAERDALKAEHDKQTLGWMKRADSLTDERNALRALVADLVGAMHSVAEFDWTSAAPILDRARAALAKGEK